MDNNYSNTAVATGKMPCKYGPVFALYLYRIESNHVNMVQKRVCIYMAFLCDTVEQKFSQSHYSHA